MSKGVTLIELMIVVLILGALAAVSLPRISGNTAQAANTICETNVKIINDQIELYKLNTGSYPASLKILLNDPDYFPDGPPECPFEESYRMLKSTGRVKKHLHSGGAPGGGWGWKRGKD